jgi:hypothetical protein
MARKPTGNPAGRRPRSVDGVAARATLRVKLTETEHARIHELARAAGYDSVSEYVRARCL